MGKIHTLDESTISKIAAGEVIERPASVIKELIENSIDAGASNIKVEIAKSGKKLIRVIDNGCGMSREDASISFMKYTTSKIRSIEDLEIIQTMGFRGEALSSITAVAKVEITAKTKEELSGTRVTIHGGRLIGLNDIGAADGTTIQVEELFYNTPARKKYLKSDSTELVHIIDVVTKNALGHSNISFTLVHNGIEILRSSASELLDTIIHIYGQDMARGMIPVNFESHFAKITGFVSKPGITRSSLDFQSFYINNRSINSRPISYALRDGYGTLIPKGQFPIAILKIHVDTKEVDINVHPTKNQVRLSHEREISYAVTEAVRNALSNEDLTPVVEPAIQPFLYDPVPQSQVLVREIDTGFKFPIKDTERRLRYTERYTTAEGNTKANKMPELKILGQVGSLYIIIETGDGLMILDQHAAHERILFEQLMRSKRMDSQELLVPVNLELDAKERVLVKDSIPYLEEFGFRISEFGPDTFAITAVPNVLGRLEGPGLIRDIIADMLRDGKIKDSTWLFERITKSIACRGAIKAGADCSYEQMESLIEQLFRTENPSACPHGRPTMVILNRQELNKLFKRI